MSDCVGWIVRAKAGRDKDGSFCVIGRSGEYLLLADGKRRKMAVTNRMLHRQKSKLQKQQCL